MEKREKWGSRFGFIMAAVGSAVGLGNIWKFPYITGQAGGGAFILIYILLTVLVGFTIILGEIAIGRATRANAFAAFNGIKPGFGFIGILGIIASFVIVSFYSVIGGWILKYLSVYALGGSVKTDGFFTSFVSLPVEPVIWMLVFLAICTLILMRGISGGIEKVSSIMMPLLFILLAAIALRAVTLPGAGAGIEFYLKPDFSKITWDVVVSALGQVFFSLSLGMGTLITYGSYLDSRSDIVKDSVLITVLDTIVSVIAGFAVIPAVFAAGQTPDFGPSLLFVTLPHVFETIPFGHAVGAAFFLLVLFAAVTSAISLMQVVVSFFGETFRIKREAAVFIPFVCCAVIGSVASLSHGILGSISILGKNIFDFLSFFASDILLPIGGMLTCLFIAFVWTTDSACAEIKKGAKHGFKLAAFWSFLIKFVMPVIILIILLRVFGAV